MLIKISTQEAQGSHGTIRLDVHQAHALHEATKAIKPPTDGNHARFAARSAAACADVWTPEQADRLAAQIEPGGEAAIVIEGLPTNVPDSLDPSSGNRPEGLSWGVDSQQIGIINSSGRSIGYFDEYGGRLIHEIAQANKTLAKPKLSQLPASLEVHTDRSRFKKIAQCDLLVLLGLRNPDLLATRFAPGTALLKRMERRLVSPLFNDNFDFSRSGYPDYRPILMVENGELVINLPPEDLPTRNETARQAQRAFRDAAIDDGVVLKPGMMLILRNRVAVHWRNAIVSPQRWLRRGYGISRAKQELLLAHGEMDPRSLALTPPMKMAA